ncbi:hypothetical protein JW960_26165 [candidate division KSB1 bacterium]|nr:hypothetical protein [candidate division KSB1 bacterium]
MTNGNLKTPSWGQIVQWTIFIVGLGIAIGKNEMKSANLERRVESIETVQDSQNYELILYRVDETNKKIDELTVLINEYIRK